MLGPLPRSSSENRYVIVAVHHLTQNVEAAALPNGSAPEVAKLLVSSIQLRQGAARVVVSDRRTSFVFAIITICLVCLPPSPGSRLRITRRRTALQRISTAPRETCRPCMYHATILTWISYYLSLFLPRNPYISIAKVILYFAFCMNAKPQSRSTRNCHVFLMDDYRASILSHAEVARQLADCEHWCLSSANKNERLTAILLPIMSAMLSRCRFSVVKSACQQSYKRTASYAFR